MVKSMLLPVMFSKKSDIELTIFFLKHLTNTNKCKNIHKHTAV